MAATASSRGTQPGPTTGVRSKLRAIFGGRRSWEYRRDFITGVVVAQFKTEFAQYFLGWFWWILEPLASALAFFFIVFVFFHLPGDRLWIIVVSLAAWRWFSRSVDQAPHLALQFNPYLRTGGVSLDLLFVGFLAKEFVIFVIATSVILVPTAFFSTTLTWHLLEVPLIIVAQALVTYPIAVLAMILGALVHDVGKLVGLIVGIWWYFSPGLYIRSDAERIPEWILTGLTLNPFWAILTSWQNVLVRGQSADMEGLLVWIAIGSVATVLSARLLRRTRRTIIVAAEE